MVVESGERGGGGSRKRRRGGGGRGFKRAISHIFPHFPTRNLASRAQQTIHLRTPARHAGLGLPLAVIGSCRDPRGSAWRWLQWSVISRINFLSAANPTVRLQAFKPSLSFVSTLLKCSQREEGQSKNRGCWRQRHTWPCIQSCNVSDWYMSSNNGIAPWLATCFALRWPSDDLARQLPTA